MRGNTRTRVRGLACLEGRACPPRSSDSASGFYSSRRQVFSAYPPRRRHRRCRARHRRPAPLPRADLNAANGWASTIPARTTAARPRELGRDDRRARRVGTDVVTRACAASIGTRASAATRREGRRLRLDRGDPRRIERQPVLRAVAKPGGAGSRNAARNLRPAEPRSTWPSSRTWCSSGFPSRTGHLPLV
jgi:hypothetical protein